MRKNILWVVVVVAAALIQTTWLDAIRLQGVLPDLTLLLVLYFAIFHGEERAMFTGLLAGLYQDVAGNSLLGHHVVCNVVIGYAAARLVHRLITEHPAVKVGVVLCAGVVHGTLYTFIQYVLTPDMSALHTIFSTVLPGAFYTALVTPLAFVVLSKVLRFDEDAFQGGTS